MKKNFLNEQEREELKGQQKIEKNRRTLDRIRAILLADKGWTYKQIGEALFVDQETISRHIQEYNENKKITLNSGGSSSKLNQEQTQELITYLEENTYTKASNICLYVQNKYKIKYTLAGMNSWLKQHEFSYKKPKGMPAKADSNQQSAFISAFIEAYEALKKTKGKDEPVLFLDGVHPTMATKISYGWIRKGTNKLIATTASRTRMNIMGSINLETMELRVKEYPSLNSEAMVDFWKELKKGYPQAEKLHVILDQGSYNTSEQTQKGAKELGIELHYLPPYSPNLNPIERLWKVMNEQVRNNYFFGSAKEFKQKIMQFFDETWKGLSQLMRSRINDNLQPI
jgi:transposase